MHLDDLMHLIGYIIGRGLLCIAGLLTGYIGINVLIGVFRWLMSI